MTRPAHRRPPRRHAVAAATRGVAAALAVAATLLVVPTTLLVVPTTAGAAGTVNPQDVALSESASCRQGDIELIYTASGVDRQITDFTAADGTTLDHYDVAVYSSNHTDREYILSQTKQPPPAGTIVAVRVTIGASPPDAATGEFLVAYRCDSVPNEQGGHNEVVATCVGLYGTCTRTAQQVAAQLGASTTTTAPTAPAPTAVAVPAVPRFTG